MNKGICRICGEYKDLTFEHVPPKSVFNNAPATIISGVELLKSVSDDDRLPWEFNKNSGKIQQRGKGGYYLCAECNNKTGHWYAGEYKKFVSALHYGIKQAGDKEYKAMGMKMVDIRPLAIFKQIMTMFVDINEGMLGDDSLRKYLLNPEKTEFNKDRYNLYAYLHTGAIERACGISILCSPLGMVTLTEISSYPIGLVLYIDKPKNYKPEGVEITSLCEYKYDDLADLEIIIPKLENNIIFPGDFRSKEEIKDCIKQTQEHMKDITEDST